MIRVVGSVVVAALFAVGIGTVVALVIEPRLRRQFKTIIQEWIDKCAL